MIENLKEIISEFDKTNITKQIILIGFNGAIRNIELEESDES